jgi:hypothetical protein
MLILGFSERIALWHSDNAHNLRRTILTTVFDLEETGMSLHPLAEEFWNRCWTPSLGSMMEQMLNQLPSEGQSANIDDPDRAIPSGSCKAGPNSPSSFPCAHNPVVTVGGANQIVATVVKRFALTNFYYAAAPRSTVAFRPMHSLRLCARRYPDLKVAIYRYSLCIQLAGMGRTFPILAEIPFESELRVA